MKGLETWFYLLLVGARITFFLAIITFFISPPFILYGSFISRVHQHCHLGLCLSSNLDWEKQINATILKASGKLAVLRSVNFVFRATLDLV